MSGFGDEVRGLFGAGESEIHRALNSAKGSLQRGKKMAGQAYENWNDEANLLALRVAAPFLGAEATDRAGAPIRARLARQHARPYALNTFAENLPADAADVASSW